MKGQTGKTGDAAEPSFDENLAALEAIVGELDQQALGLEPALEKYREGVALVKKCQTILTSFQKQVEELSAEDGGATRPYPSDPDVRGGAASK
ncbi:MAG TPA: exodeoxyribonuclease VII small subunit [Planctomycetota bacterium]|nr:exodeoxyribonuclease VII small subunit [Planctomycetota bacterium]